MADDHVKSTHLRSDANFREYGCRIDRDLLDRVIIVAKKNFTPDASVEISTERKSNGISSKISTKTFDELLQGLRESTAAGDPNWIDNLSVWVSEFIATDDERRRVSISIDPDSVWVSVSGPDAGWVRGRIGELHDLFEYSKVRWVISLPIRYGIIGGALGLYFISSTILIGLEIAHFKLGYTVALWAILALWLVSFYLNRKLNLYWKTKISILPDQAPNRKDWVAISTLIATIFILIATVVGIVVSTVH